VQFSAILVMGLLEIERKIFAYCIINCKSHFFKTNKTKILNRLRKKERTDDRLSLDGQPELSERLKREVDYRQGEGALFGMSQNFCTMQKNKGE